MKTQVIKLDVHDDVTSVKDKIAWAKAERILLVFRRHSRNLGRPLDLRLFQRHAGKLGAQLAIVTRSSDLRRAAEELHIPTFSRTGSAMHLSWERGRKPGEPVRLNERPDLNQMRRDAFLPEAGWRSLPWFRFLFFSLGVLALLAILSIFIPSATIQISPATNLQSLRFPVNASSNVATVNLAGSIPRQLTSVVVEETKTMQVSGTVTIPDAQAQGLARFRNLSTALTGIPAGTVIRTQSNPIVRFATTMDEVVAAGLNKTVDIPIRAVEAGSVGNLPAGSLVVFEGDLGTSLAVTNPEPTLGGSDRTAAIQTSADRSILHEALLADIFEECKTNLQQALLPGDIFFPDTQGISQVLKEMYFPAEGQSGDMLSLTLRVQCQAYFAFQKDIKTLAGMSLDASRQEGFTPAADGLTILPISQPHTDEEGITHWEMQAQRVLRARLDPLNVIQLSLGGKPAEVILRLEKSLPLEEAPVIHLRPGWWPWLPVVPFRIIVTMIG